MSIKEDDYLSLSGIQHFAYCRRQWALIHIEQQWSENYQTTSGELMHKKRMMMRRLKSGEILLLPEA